MIRALNHVLDDLQKIHPTVLRLFSTQESFGLNGMTVGKHKAVALADNQPRHYKHNDDNARSETCW
jgi:hypothetical protein